MQNGEETVITAKVTGAAGDVSETKSNIILDTGAGAGTGFRLFIDEDKDRNEVLSRDEAMSDHALNKTSATLQIPTTVHSGDVITITATGKNPETYTVVSNDGTSVVIRDADGDIVPLTSDNKLTISDVHIDKDHPAKVEATINGVTKTAEAKLETFDAANLKVEFKEDDASRDGKIDRDESVSVDGVKETTISVQVPYNVITGDKVQVLITEPKPDGTTATRPVNVTNLNSKVESFENIQLKGGSEIKFNAQDVFDITDNLDSVLKIKGDETNKVDVKDKWHEDTSVHADAGFRGYTSNDMIDGHTIHIQIDDKVQTDL